MRFLSIASGSSGNCIYIGDEKTHLLIDTGISKKRVEEGLNSIGLSLMDIDGILLTHEHSDHIMGLGVILRKYDIPVYGSAGTIDAVKYSKYVDKVDMNLFREIYIDKKFKINTLTVNPFEISHDATMPCAYKVNSNEKSCAVATDMGCYNDYIVNNLTDTDVMLLEANHDIRMLQTGPYPYYLKQRILSDHGHLCNEMSGRLIDSLLCDKTKKIFLGHLSKENNFPDLAYESVRAEINLSESAHNADDFDISVAHRDKPSECIEF
ncbi:MAG: MBL fold metallo-hydrolase [Lachnospiraceae bacterium]|nr:MBL fold metallo-hydrolase [Lachnospiraceae bacterium]